MRIPFVKMSGAGNDFVVVDNRSKIINDPTSFAIKACHRRFGVGADGVLLLELAEIADFEMKYYNADGTNAGMCGNGGRCLAKFAYDIGVVKSNHFKFNGFGHIYDAFRIEPDVYELKMKDPAGFILEQTLLLKKQTLKANYVNTGTDHAVIFLNDNPDIGPLETIDVFGMGREIRYHELYRPKGVNVNFVSIKGGNIIRIRTYERGVEDETLACGTGSVASALLSSLKFQLVSPIKVVVESGEVLEVSFKKELNDFYDIHLKGSAKMTFSGFVDV